MQLLIDGCKRNDRESQRLLHQHYYGYAMSICVRYSRTVDEAKEIVNDGFMKVFRKMKKTAFLVNTARGKIVNEKDLVLALKTDLIAGAALDVFEREPISSKHPLTKIENVVLAPHIGSSTVETRKKMAEIAVRNLVLGLQKKKMVYSV